MSSIVSAFFRAFCPPTGLEGVPRATACRGASFSVHLDRARFERVSSPAAGPSSSRQETSTSRAEACRSSDLEPPFGRCRDRAEGRRSTLSVGFCIMRPGADLTERRVAIAHAMSTMVEAAAEVPGCLSAIVAAQGAPITRAPSPSPLRGAGRHLGEPERAARPVLGCAAGMARHGAAVVCWRPVEAPAIGLRRALDRGGRGEDEDDHAVCRGGDGGRGALRLPLLGLLQIRQSR